MRPTTKEQHSPLTPTTSHLTSLDTPRLKPCSLAGNNGTTQVPQTRPKAHRHISARLSLEGKSGGVQTSTGALAQTGLLGQVRRNGSTLLRGRGNGVSNQVWGKGEGRGKEKACGFLVVAVFFLTRGESGFETFPALLLCIH